MVSDLNRCLPFSVLLISCVYSQHFPETIQINQATVDQRIPAVQESLRFRKFIVYTHHGTYFGLRRTVMMFGPMTPSPVPPGSSVLRGESLAVSSSFMLVFVIEVAGVAYIRVRDGIDVLNGQVSLGRARISFVERLGRLLQL